MKKILITSLVFGWLITFLFGSPQTTQAVETYKLQITPIPCQSYPGLGNCHPDLQPIYQQNQEACVDTYDTFIQNPVQNHFWAIDPEVTAQGKADDRARQFIYWAISRNSIDEHPILKTIWGVSRNMVFFFIFLIAAISGIGLIVGQRTNFDFKIKVWPLIFRLGGLLLYVAFSATIVLFLIQLSEVLMKFFIEKLGGQDLFNIYFAGSISSERNYIDFVGCRDLNFKVQEAIETNLFMLKLTNVVYYLMGAMIILRKIILWLLLFVSPFLAVLAPFVFIRNVGWIWIGVFFQWLFYGPLLALFLGALSAIWKAGIPFPFDFSRVNTAAGYVYPTAMTLIYAGPAQIGLQPWGILNNVNYIDTFAEYAISILMLLAVTFFPWWLLRIFRDYCCDGIYAAKNILLSMYDQMRGSPSPQPTPPPFNIGAVLKTGQQMEIPIKVRLETMEEIKRTKTEDITRSLNISTKKLTDIASFETNKQVQQHVRQNIDYLSNPMKAETPTERQKFMNLRTELFNRAVKADQTAQQILSSISGSRLEQRARRQELVKTIPRIIPVAHILSVKVKMPQEKASSIANALIKNVSVNTQLVASLAKTVNLQSQQILAILHLLVQNINQPTADLTETISQQTSLEKEKVDEVIKTISQAMKTNKELLETVAKQEDVKEEVLTKFVEEQISIMVEPGKQIVEAISIPPTIPIEEYESVKKMWQKQYEQGEVPVTENIKSRAAWVDQDIVFITNALNKLMSPTEELRLEGLDDLGYILPIFMINNMKGEELVVYLKAKLEAAKSVGDQLVREKEITEKLKAKTEEQLVEVAAPKTEEAEKTMEMAEELKMKIK